MTKKRPPLSDLIGKTAGANRRADADAFREQRRREILQSAPAETSPPPPPDVPEPLPVIDDPDRYGQEFWQRFIKEKGLAETPAAKKSSKKKPGRPSKKPSPFRVIDGEDPKKP